MSSRGTPPATPFVSPYCKQSEKFFYTILQFNHSGSAHPPKFRAGPIRIMMQRTMGCTRLCRGVLDCAGKPKIHRPLSFKPSTVDCLHDLDGLGWSAETEYQAFRTSDAINTRPTKSILSRSITPTALTRIAAAKILPNPILLTTIGSSPCLTSHPSSYALNLKS